MGADTIIINNAVEAMVDGGQLQLESRVGDKTVTVGVSDTGSGIPKKNFEKICRPQTNGLWKKLKKTLEFLPSFNCPTVIRFTLARNLNLEYPKLFAKLLTKVNPTYLEPKSYMHVGFSRLRMDYSNMPTHMEIRKFACQLANELGYNILDESPDSRIVLLSHLEKAIKLT